MLCHRLKQQQEEKLGPSSSVYGPAPSQHVNESADEHVSRLFEERDTLLRTGVYTHEDRIIAELNRQIQEAMEDRGNLWQALEPTNQRQAQVKELLNKNAT